jgi:hypothetical protein
VVYIDAARFQALSAGHLFEGAVQFDIDALAILCGAPAGVFRY